jgi:replicative DNA helicase
MSVAAEQGVIAAILKMPHIAKKCGLSASEFQSQACQDIYQSIREKSDSGELFDLITIGTDLNNKLPEKDAAYLFDFMGKLMAETAVMPGMFETYCHEIKRSYRLTEIRTIANTLLIDVEESKSPESADKAIAALMALENTGRNYSWTMEHAVKAGLRQVEEVSARDGMVGVNTGLPELNDATGGFNDSDLVIIGARPAMGKTALLLNLANNCNVPAGIVSAEQGHDQIGKRMLSIEGSCDAQRIRKADLSGDFVNDLGRAARRLIDKKIWINDRPAINIIQLCRQVREWAHRYEIKIAFVDYVQKIKGSRRGMSPKEEAAEVVGMLKNLAKELGIPIVALAQVNREVDKRPDPRPNMGDLSNAAEIEQEADLVIMLYRDEAYNPDTPDKGIAELLVEKNRHGPTGRIRCQWIGRYMQFKELTSQNYMDHYS